MRTCFPCSSMRESRYERPFASFRQLRPFLRKSCTNRFRLVLPRLATPFLFFLPLFLLVLPCYRSRRLGVYKRIFYSLLYTRCDREPLTGFSPRFLIPFPAFPVGLKKNREPFFVLISCYYFQNSHTHRRRARRIRWRNFRQGHQAILPASRRTLVRTAQCVWS